VTFLFVLFASSLVILSHARPQLSPPDIKFRPALMFMAPTASVPNHKKAEVEMLAVKCIANCRLADDKQ
jgi:hypothetical protein